MHNCMYKSGDHSGFLTEKNEKIKFSTTGYLSKLWATHKIEYYAAL